MSKMEDIGSNPILISIGYENKQVSQVVKLAYTKHVIDVGGKTRTGSSPVLTARTRITRIM